MIYLDNGATSFPKPPAVIRAVEEAMTQCANPGRGSHAPAELAARRIYSCRTAAAELFDCEPEQVVFTSNCTHGLNMAIQTLVRPGGRVVISGFEHNAVTRPLHARNARITVAGRRLFDWEEMLDSFARALKTGPDAVIFTHVSNVFGYVLPVEQMAKLCRERRIPFVIDAAQSAGNQALSLRELGADFIAMPGHKGLLGPMGTGILLCGRTPKPLLCGGTGSDSVNQKMPGFLPDRGEAGTANVPGIAGLEAGIRLVMTEGTAQIGQKEAQIARDLTRGLAAGGMQVFAGKHQGGVVSFRCGMDCQRAAEQLAEQGIALRSGLHCAPLAHKSAGTLGTGTLRLSVGWDTDPTAAEPVIRTVMSTLPPFER